MRLIRFFSSELFSKLGTCMKCMRQAFIAALTGALLASLATVTHQAGVFLLGAWCISIGLLALWVSHGLVFTARSIVASPVRQADMMANQGPRGVDAAFIWTRRRFFSAAVRVLLFSAAASALPRSARAEDCNCYTENDCDCPPAFPQCVFNPTTGDAICCGQNTTGCAGPTQTWCCAPNHGCSGEEGSCF
jgi:hypothetical protein